MLRLSAEDSSETVHSGILTRASFMHGPPASVPMIADSGMTQKGRHEAALSPFVVASLMHRRRALALQRHINRKQSVRVPELALEPLRRRRVGRGVAVVVAVVIGCGICKRRDPEDESGREREGFQD